MIKNWFEVDKHGLARILERKGKEFVLFELVQNAWDEPGVTKVGVSLEIRGRNLALLVVEDDAPEGFRDLSHAFTLFADSTKKSNPQQRGRFNLGEKLVLAISDEVTIRTTRGGIRFDADGRHTLRTSPSPKRSRALRTQRRCRPPLSFHAKALRGVALTSPPPTGPGGNSDSWVWAPSS